MHFTVLLESFKQNKIIFHGQSVENENLISIFRRIKNLIELENLNPKAQTMIKK